VTFLQNALIDADGRSAHKSSLKQYSRKRYSDYTHYRKGGMFTSFGRDVSSEKGLHQKVLKKGSHKSRTF
jgi:hypothetical protein